MVALMCALGLERGAGGPMDAGLGAYSPRARDGFPIAVSPNRKQSKQGIPPDTPAMESGFCSLGLGWRLSHAFLMGRVGYATEGELLFGHDRTESPSHACEINASSCRSESSFSRPTASTTRRSVSWELRSSARALRFAITHSTK